MDDTTGAPGQEHGAGEARRRDAKCLCYGKVRKRIQTGDIFLFRGRSPLSRFIQWGSKSPYSHVGMAAWWGTRLGVFQSAGRGVSFDPMSVAVDAYDGQVDWWSLTEEHACDFDRDLLVETAFSELGKRYGYGALVRLVFRMTMQRFRFTPDPLAHPSTLFCSQYVSLCYRKAGLDLRLDAADDCTSPGDLATSGYLEQRGVLHRNGEQGPDTIAHEARRPPTRRRRAEAPPRELAAL